MKLAPIADKVAATMRKREEPDDDFLAEKIQEEVHWASGGELDWKATDIVVGLVLKRLRTAPLPGARTLAELRAVDNGDWPDPGVKGGGVPMSRGC
jgi:hypothetical protein